MTVNLTLGRRSRLTAAALATALASGGGTAAAAASTPDHAPHATACVNLPTLTELTYKASADTSAGPLPSVGDSATYDDIVYGLAVATGTGTLDINRPVLGVVHGSLTVPTLNAAGHPELHLTETVLLRDGSFQVSGDVDAAVMFGGQWVTLTATGTSGVYRGMTGTRSFQLLEALPTALFNAKYSLCPPAAATNPAS